jgi:sec-independent protein translocase protein TatA
MPGFIGIQEIVLVIVVLTLVFGARRLPEIGRSLGQGMRKFKDGVTGRAEHDIGADRPRRLR